MFFNYFTRNSCKNRLVIGIDLGSSAMKVVVLQNNAKSGPEVVDANIYELPAQNISSRVPKERIKSYAALLIKFMEGSRTKFASGKKTFVVGLNAQDALLKSIHVNRREQNRFRHVLESQLDRWMPGLGGELVVDHEISPFCFGGVKQKRGFELMVALARYGDIRQIRNLLHSVGIEPETIDLEWAALINTLFFCHPEALSSSNLLLDLGAGGCKVIAVGRGRPFYTNFINIDEFSTNTQTPEAVEKISSDRRPTPPHSLYEPGGAGHIKEMIAYVSSQVEKTLKAMPFKNGENDITAIYLTGGLSISDTVSNSLSDAFSLPVVNVDPFRSLVVRDKIQKRAYFAVATGLALRGLYT